MGMDISSGYEHTYQAIIHKLAGCDFAEAAARLGLNPPVNGVVKITFLGREYEISPAGITAPDGLPSDPNDRSILIYYITSPGGGEPECSYRMLHHFIPGALLGGGNIAWLTAPLGRKFGNDRAGFCGALKRLGAMFEGSPRAGEYVWAYRILPKMPIQIIYVEADDEFPCEIKLKLDNSAGRFMEFECLAFLCGCFVRTLSNL